MIGRWTVAAAIGVVVAAVAGGLALLLSPVAPLVSGVVFAAVSLPFGLALGWVVAVAPRTAPRPPTAEDDVETRLLRDALSGTATDLVVVVGLLLVAVSLTRAELPTQPTLVGVLAVAFASATGRYAWARTRAVRG